MITQSSVHRSRSECPRIEHTWKQHQWQLPIRYIRLRCCFTNYQASNLWGDDTYIIVNDILSTSCTRQSRCDSPTYRIFMLNSEITLFFKHTLFHNFMLNSLTMFFNIEKVYFFSKIIKSIFLGYKNFDQTCFPMILNV
mgnify:CR=1 FL=1